jgi:lysosomal Pro-X carboxypeptidase
MFANNTGFMWENGPQFRAMNVFAEHRYYGTSMPYGNDSFSSLNKVGYLTTEQALADFANNIEYIKRKYKCPDSPVILFGGSYGGMLATWMRIKYPHLSIGALAGSAPIFQFPGIYNCSLYTERLTKDYTEYSPSCSESIRKSWSSIRKKAETPEGRNFLSRTFNVCEEEQFKDKDDVDKLITYLIAAYDSMSMTDYPNPADFLQPLPAYPIKEACKFLNEPNSQGENLIKRVYSAISIFYNYTGQVPCTTFVPNEMDRGWGIQACSEMVMPICSNGVTDMFEPAPFDLEEYSRDCFDKYGVRPDRYLAIREWGGRDIQDIRNIIFSNGERDPWSLGGVFGSDRTVRYDNSVHIINIPHACHHEDLRGTGKNDPQLLRDVRRQEVRVIGDWIRDYRQTLRDTHF